MKTMSESKFINSVLRKIRDKKIRERVSAELRAHISDGRDAYVKQGLSEAEALKKSIADTGGAKLIAERFNKIYSPKNPRLRPALSFKTMLRTPLKTALTFLLIAAASFALFSRVTDYAVTSREMERAMNFYTGVAALDTSTPVAGIEKDLGGGVTIFAMTHREDKLWPSDEQLEAFSSLPGVTHAETRYMTAGLIEDFKRLNEISGFYIIEGTYAGYDNNTPEFIFLNLTDCNILAGDFTLNSEKTAKINVITIEDMYFGTNPYTVEFFDNLEIGSRVLNIGTMDNKSKVMLSASALFTEELSAFYMLDGLPENYLETEEFSFIRTMADNINTSVNTFDIVYTSDMRAIPRFNERKMVMSRGRMLNAEDTAACVVSRIIYNRYDLNLGDKLTIELGDRYFPQNANRGTVSNNPEIKTNFVKTVELEIVGVYHDVDSKQARGSDTDWAYTENTVFVPLSLLPDSPHPPVQPKSGAFSVLIENARNTDAFLEAARPLVEEEMGLTMRWSDGGWTAVKEGINASALTSLLTTVFYTVGAGLALLLSAYLFVARNKKSYAIMRALGTPRKKANEALSLPFGLLSFSAIPTGGIIGLIYASRNVKTALENLSKNAPSDYITDATLPVSAIILCLICELVFITLLTLLFLRKMGKTPPLALLQGDVIRVGEIENFKATVTRNERAKSDNKETAVSATFGKMPEKRKYSALRHVTAYIFRHARRVKWKTAISLSLAAVLTSAVGLLAVTRLLYQELYGAVEVKCAAYGFSSSAVKELSDSPLTENFYYYGSFKTFVNGINFNSDLILTNDFEQYMKNVSDSYSVEYAEGADVSLFSEFADYNALCMLGSEIAQMLNVKKGDEIFLIGENKYDMLTKMFESKERLQMLESGEMTEDEFTAAKEEFIARENVAYKVAGIVDSADGNVNMGIFAPSGKNAATVYGQEFALEHSEFMLTDNERLDGLMRVLGNMINSYRPYAPGASYFLDTTQLDNIRRVRDLLILLFPVAVAGAVLIGLTAPGLLILQSSKEAAILRVLGATKKRVRCILMFEQIGLCVVGIALAAGGLAIYNSGLFTRSAETLALCGVLYLLGCICAGFAASAAATKRKVLVLLQEKE